MQPKEHHPASPRWNLVRIAIVASLLATGVVAVSPAVEAKGPGRILVLEGVDNDAASSLNTVPVPACGSGNCYEVVPGGNFATFTYANYAPYSVIYVGWDPNAVTMSALQTQAPNIARWISEGGSVIANPTHVTFNGQPGFSWLPEGSAFSLAAYSTNSVQLTALGAVHPAYAGTTPGDLSGWFDSTHIRFGAWPTWLQPLARGPGGHEVTLAGHYGQGCVLVTGQDVDYHATAGHVGAQTWLRDLVGWARSCECVDYVCEPFVRLIGLDLRLDSLHPEDDLGRLLRHIEGFGQNPNGPQGIGTLSGHIVAYPWYATTVTLELNPCRCILRKVEFSAEVTSDVFPTNDGLLPTLTQTTPFSWTVTTPDADRYTVTFKVTLDCPEDDGTLTVKVFEKTWSMGP